MARFIDADRALEIVYEHGIAHPNVYYLTNYAMAILQEAPTVDAVEVVRCGFCKNAEPYDCTINGTAHRLYECKKDKAAIGYNKVVAKDDFCSYGERKGGDGDG